jgi:hypothetical protein
MNKLRIAAIILLVVVAVNALAAGYFFMSDPSGEKLGIPLAVLRYSSFHSFFFPGLILFTMIGILCLVTAISLIRHWPLSLALLSTQGLVLTGWIVIQVLLLRQFNALHVILGLTGIFFIFSGITLLNNK